MYNFECPVYPGQTIYTIHFELKTGQPYIKEDRVYKVIWKRNNVWIADLAGLESIEDWRWMRTAFPTWEEAKIALKQMEDKE